VSTDAADDVRALYGATPIRPRSPIWIRCRRDRRSARLPIF